METSEYVLPPTIDNATKIIVTSIANIRTELKQFNAIYYLKKTAFEEAILSPASWKQPVVTNKIPIFTCESYVSNLIV